MCTCGTDMTHELARRRTADGFTVVLWSDGAVTGILGMDVHVRAPRNPGRVSLCVEAGWLAFGEVEFFDRAEVGDLVRMARWALEQVSLAPREFLRRRMAGERFRVGSRGAVIRAVPPETV